MLRAIVDRAQQGDEEAFGALVREVGDRCIFIAHRILRDANLAEDAVQVALVQVWRDLPALRDLDRFEAWLHRILVNACYAEARRGRHFAAHVVLLETDAPAAADEFLTVHDRDQLDRGFRRLPPEQRAVLVFHYALGLTVPEVAGSPRHPARHGEVPTLVRDRGDPRGARSRRPNAHPRPGEAGMTKPRDPESLLAAYLTDGMDVLPDRVVDSGPGGGPSDPSADRAPPVEDAVHVQDRTCCGGGHRRGRAGWRALPDATRPARRRRSGSDAWSECRSQSGRCPKRDACGDT